MVPTLVTSAPGGEGIRRSRSSLVSLSYIRPPPPDKTKTNQNPQIKIKHKVAIYLTESDTSSAGMGGRRPGGEQGKQRKRPRGPEVPHRWDGGGGGSGEAAAGLLVALPPQGVSCARLENHGRESYFPFQSPSFYSSKGKISPTPRTSHTSRYLLQRPP